MYDFQKRQYSPGSGFWIFNISCEVRVLKQSQCALFGHKKTHDNVVCSHKYDKFLKSVDSGACHMLWSILLWIVRPYLLTIKYRVVILSRYKHFRTIWEHVFENSPTNFVQLLWSDGQSIHEKILCGVVESSYFLTHNFAPRISSRDFPYPKTMKKYEDFEGMEIFPLHQQKFTIQTWLCTCPQYLYLFRIVFENIPSLHDPRKMLVLPKSTSLLSTFHIGSRFFSSQFDVIHTHRKNIPFTVDE